MPSLYLLHGDDELAMKKFAEALYAKLGDPSIADLNFTRLEGKGLDFNELRNATGSMPFLADRRVVILHDPFASLKSDDAIQRFKSLLDGLPESTALVLLVDDRIDRRDWAVLKEDHWLLKWARDAGDRAVVREMALPDLMKMPAWIRKQAEQRKGEFTAQAASALMERVGNDTRVAELEVAKLLDYVNYSRPVSREDVELLTAQVDDPDIFKLVDALGEKDGKTALDELHMLLDNRDWQPVFAMIVRQFRLLLLTREVLDRNGGSNQVTEALRGEPFRVNPYLAARLTKQAASFSLANLEAIYRRLLDIDASLKSQSLDPSVVLATFIGELIQT